MLIDEYRKDKQLVHQLYLNALGTGSQGHRAAQNEIAKVFSVSFEEAGKMIADALLQYANVLPLPPTNAGKYKKSQVDVKKPPEVSPFATF